MDEIESINIALLYRKFRGEKLSKEESLVFNAWYAESEKHRQYYKLFCRQQEKIMVRDRSRVNEWKGLVVVKRGKNRHGVMNWWQYAGVAVIILGVFILGWRYWPVGEKVTNPEPTQICPGQVAVTLRLSQGEQIVLDSSQISGTINRDCVTIHVEKGMLRYGGETSIAGKETYNELIVPPSGEYVVELADGTKVFLNSESRLRYPTAFLGAERRVELSGEAYFVVAKEERSFIVETRLEEVKVFGTEFNVMAYEDEEFFQTTLVKGSVGVCVKGVNMIDFQKIVPGEQFLLNRQTLETQILPVDVFTYVAWKDGLFVSRNDDLETILRKVSRWFDVEIFYQEPKLKKKRFFGIMKRQANLQEVLDVIAEAGDVHFNVNGRTVVVSE